jgi:hypothetical protein
LRLLSRGLGLRAWSFKDGLMSPVWESNETMTLKLDVDSGKHQFVVSLSKREVVQVVREAKRNGITSDKV